MVVINIVRQYQIWYRFIFLVCIYFYIFSDIFNTCVKYIHQIWQKPLKRVVICAWRPIYGTALLTPYKPTTAHQKISFSYSKSLSKNMNKHLFSFSLYHSIFIVYMIITDIKTMLCCLVIIDMKITDFSEVCHLDTHDVPNHWNL